MAPTTKPKNTNQCQSLMLTALSAYYKKNTEIRKTLYSLINGESKISLRLIDWFVTHYARVYSIIYWIDEKNNTIYENYPIEKIEQNINNLRKINLYLDYRVQLKSYKKMFFDPFRRYSRITYVLEEEPLLSIESTVGQLNFFRWALHNGVINYIQNNIDKIETSMTNFQKQNKIPDDNGKVNTDNKSKNKSKTKQKTHVHAHTVTHVPCLIHFD
jgi:hypothetical protein